ncbi:Prophage integrase IntS [Saezia sanguinis]|uniref:Prophage integrase IntS n=1 Tax=Saezia sanguinis TaxID=1965230 RepID=A0A433SB66_9BURK|nr:integrase arm-type DNA-binding domain-containing protein [Saezia sanguinis]RUS65996.1 Prophage integrase IntS [Saezia sanguinis]
MALTDTVVKQARPKNKPYLINDLNGLALYVAGNGNKQWHFRFSWQGKQQRISLGRYPALTLKQARNLRDEAHEQIAVGIDPRYSRKREAISHGDNTQGLITFREFAEVWKAFKFFKLGTHDPKNRQGTRVQIERYLRKDILPELGNLPLERITRADVLAVQRRIEARGSLSIAEKVRGWLNEIFRHAVAEGIIDMNPASEMDIVALPQRPTQYNPFLRMHEIPELLAALHQYQGERQTVLGLRLLLLTGVRTGELRYAEQDEFDLDNALWRVPAESVKQLKKHARSESEEIPPYIVPLSRQAVEVLRELFQLKYPWQNYLFRHRSEPRQTISENTLNQALHRMGFKNRLTGHGIRATLSTALNEMDKYKKAWIEAQLSHSDKDAVSGTYNHALYVEQRRQMMQDWADRLDVWKAEGLEKQTKES